LLETLVLLEAILLREVSERDADDVECDVGERGRVRAPTTNDAKTKPEKDQS